MGCPALHIDSRFSAYTPKLEVVRDFEYLSKLDVVHKKTTPKKVFKYYPYGMLMPGRFGEVVNSSYAYGFQGQEKDDEIKGKGNSLNYKYRMHDPRLGRFFAVDPLEGKYPFYSPYHFSSNSPIISIELEGLESSVTLNYNEISITVSRDKNGNFFVTQSQYLKLAPLGKIDVSSGAYNRQDFTPGSYWEVNCPHCSTPAATIILPSEKTVRARVEMKMIDMVIEGKVETERAYGVYNSNWAYKEGSDDRMFYRGIGFLTNKKRTIEREKNSDWYSDYTQLTTLAIGQAKSLENQYNGFVIDKIVIQMKEKTVLDADILKKFEGFNVKIVYTGEQLYKDSTPVDILYNFHYSYDKTVKTPDITVKISVPETVYETVDPVVLNK